MIYSFIRKPAAAEVGGQNVADNHLAAPATFSSSDGASELRRQLWLVRVPPSPPPPVAPPPARAKPAFSFAGAELPIAGTSEAVGLFFSVETRALVRVSIGQELGSTGFRVTKLDAAGAVVSDGVTEYRIEARGGDR